MVKKSRKRQRVGKEVEDAVTASAPVKEEGLDMETMKGRGERKEKRKSTTGVKSKVPSRKSERSWKNVTPAEDSLELLVGNAEGGFLSLEELDGEDWQIYGAEGEENPSPPEEKRKRRKKQKTESATAVGDVILSNEGNSKSATKRRRGVTLVAGSSGTDGAIADNAEGGSPSASPEVLLKVKKPKLGSRARKLLRTRKSGAGHKNQTQIIGDPGKGKKGAAAESKLASDDGECAMDMSAWVDMRLHPKLERAIAGLKFKEPTPIQRHCIPAAAHKGKDVIGAAETGSGKTLAFGLPILQRLLDEQEKAANQASVDDDSHDNGEGDAKRESVTSPLRALIVTPTRELALQICDHLKAVAKWTNIKLMPIVGGMATQKQQRLLKQMPEIVVGTPGRLWELMSDGEKHLLELQYLSFFVLDEADRMVEKGHFKELQSIIDVLPNRHHGRSGKANGTVDSSEPEVGGEDGDPPRQRKRRQTLVFSASLALPRDFKSKLKKGHHVSRAALKSVDSVVSLSKKAGVSREAAIVDLTSASVVASRLSESFVECSSENKDQILYYVLKVHGGGRTLVFCTSIAALRRVAALLRLLQIPVCPLHAQMQQKARLKAMDRFRENEDAVLVATDVAARGLDVAGIRTVVHYQLPHSAEIYVHRSGRTARASTDGISIVLVSPSDRQKYLTLCRALSRPDGLQKFPVNMSYLPAIEKQISLAIKVDKLLRKQSQSKAEKTWLARNAETLEIDMESSDDEAGQERPFNKKDVARTKSSSSELRMLQKELQEILSQPVKPKAFSSRYITGAGMTSLLTKQLQEYVLGTSHPDTTQNGNFVVIGQEKVQPLEALKLSNRF